jgi:hypothetical protein
MRLAYGNIANSPLKFDKGIIIDKHYRNRHILLNKIFVVRVSINFIHSKNVFNVV